MRALLVGVAVAIVAAGGTIGAAGFLAERAESPRPLAGPVAVAGDASLRGDDAAGGMRPSDAAAGAMRPGDAASAALGAPEAPRAASPAGRGDGPGVRAVRFDFDSGLDGSVVDRSGQVRLRTRTNNGGRLDTSGRGDGLAVRFPARCLKAAGACPRAILEAEPAGSLSPGRRAVRWGAAVRMSPGDTAAGANVVQKGYSTSGQFKLQVDGAAGRPSCAVVGAGPTRIYLVKADVTVADGTWHTVDCARVGPVLSITVDGHRRGSVSVPARLSIVTRVPLRVGGKGLRGDNDQFAGMIDDVYVRIGAG